MSHDSTLKKIPCSSRIRSDTNAEITRMIMLRERSGAPKGPRPDCDCGILSEVLVGLDKVVEGDDAAVIEVGESSEWLFNRRVAQFINTTK